MENRSLTVIVKTTENCNLRCKYCSVGEPSTKTLTLKKAVIMMEKIVTRVPKSQTTFIWHGGEPMLAGINFYQQIVEAQRPLIESGYKICNLIQTNGTLINDEWAKFFKEQNFSVGMSLDGPKEINDRSRIFSNDRGAFDAIMRGSNILDQHEVEHAFIVVINRYNVDSIKEIINFMRQQNKQYKLINCIPVGRAGQNIKDIISAETKFSACQLDVFNTWLKDGHSSEEHALQEFLLPMLGARRKICMFMENCQESFIGVDHEANAYPCGRFVGDKNLGGAFRLGNFMTDTFEQIWNHPVKLAFAKRHEQITACQPCQFKKICNGGCPALGILNGGMDQPDSNCAEYFKIFSTMDKRLREEAGLPASA